MRGASSFPQRRSIRLWSWDHSRPGWYFVTITTRLGWWYFGVNHERGLRLSEPGRMVSATWAEMPLRFPLLQLDAWVVMPNHFHAILHLIPGTRASRRTVGRIISAFKSLTTVRYVRGIRACGWPPFHRRLWHRNYHDRILRTPTALAATRRYIEQNPQIHLQRARRQ